MSVMFFLNGKDWWNQGFKYFNYMNGRCFCYKTRHVWQFCISYSLNIPIPSMYGIFTYIWLMFIVNVGKYTIHGCYGINGTRLYLLVCKKNTSINLCCLLQEYCQVTMVRGRFLGGTIGLEFGNQQFFVTLLGWLSDPFKWLSDLQLGDEKVTLNHLV